MDNPNIRVEWFGTFMVIQPLVDEGLLPPELRDVLTKQKAAYGQIDYYSLIRVDGCFLIRTNPSAFKVDAHPGNFIYDMNQAGAVYQMGEGAREAFESVLAEWYMHAIKMTHYRTFIGASYMPGADRDQINHSKSGCVARDAAFQIIDRERKNRNILNMVFKIDYVEKLITIGGE